MNLVASILFSKTLAAKYKKAVFFKKRKALKKLLLHIKEMDIPEDITDIL